MLLLPFLRLLFFFSKLLVVINVIRVILVFVVILGAVIVSIVILATSIMNVIIHVAIMFTSAVGLILVRMVGLACLLLFLA